MTTKTKTPADWTPRAQVTLVKLLANLESRDLTTIECIGAIRALTEAITAARALLPSESDDE